MRHCSAKTIFLIGPKHSGKTSAGTALAKICSGVFIDLDDLIAERTGKSPRTLYAEGPDVFRKAEAGALASLLEAETGPGAARIVAAGGGITDNAEALALLEKTETAVLVYLAVSAETAWQRISRAGELPPFLKTENPRETHRLLHERRSAACRSVAALTVNAEDKTPEEAAEEICVIYIDKIKKP